MGKGPCTFKEADVSRALRAAKKAGVPVTIELDLERKRMIITPIRAGEFANEIANPWDEVLNDAPKQKRSA
jgi:hypothetical protein